jgi:hypothetical protein
MVGVVATVTSSNRRWFRRTTNYRRPDAVRSAILVIDQMHQRPDGEDGVADGFIFDGWPTTLLAPMCAETEACTGTTIPDVLGSLW